VTFYQETIIFCWIVFLTAWAILAMVFNRDSQNRITPNASGFRLLIFAAVLLGYWLSGHALNHPSGSFPAWLLAIGTLLCVTGLVFATWARVILGRYWGMPMTLHEDPQLITTGPYRLVRHPIYTGLIAMWIGTIIVYPLSAPVGIAIISYSIFSALREERDMEKRFPEAYPAYAKRSRMLLPYLI